MLPCSVHHSPPSSSSSTSLSPPSPPALPDTTHAALTTPSFLHLLQPSSLAPTHPPMSSHFALIPPPPPPPSSSPSSSSPASNLTHSAPTTTGTSRKSRRASTKPLLSDTVKKRNHIASEQRRRANIRLGFDQLISLVPGLDTMPSRSESLILSRSAHHLAHLLTEHTRWKTRARYLQHLILSHAHMSMNSSITSNDLIDQSIGDPNLISDDDDVVKREVGATKIRTYRRTIFSSTSRAKCMPSTSSSDDANTISNPLNNAPNRHDSDGDAGINSNVHHEQATPEVAERNV